MGFKPRLEENTMTKIDVVSGFLGAGKTTLIKKLLKEALDGSKTVLIENEFGEIGIDGGFLKESGIEIKEMNSGCICCSLVGDFGTSLKEVISTYAPERILIEPSGVGKLSDVLKAVENVAGDLVAEEFAEVLHIHLALGCIYHCYCTIDLHIQIFLDIRHDIAGHKRGLSLSRRIERRDTHQTVHTFF